DALASLSRVELVAGGDAATTFSSNVLTNIDGSILLADNGATIRLPSLTSYHGRQEYSTYFQAQSGGVIDLPNLTALPGGLAFAVHQLRAFGGGQVLAPRVAAQQGGAIQVLSQDASSLVDLRALPSLDSDAFGFSQIEINSKGQIRLDALAAIHHV